MCRGHFRLLEYPKIEKTCARSLFAEKIPYTGHRHITGGAYYWWWGIHSNSSASFYSQVQISLLKYPVPRPMPISAQPISAQARANQCPGPCQSVPRPVPISAQARANQCPGPCQSVPRPVPISAQARVNQCPGPANPCPGPCQSVPRPVPMCLKRSCTPEEVWLHTSWLKPRGHWCTPT